MDIYSRLQRCKKIFGVFINRDFVVYKEGFYGHLFEVTTMQKNFWGCFTKMLKDIL